MARLPTRLAFALALFFFASLAFAQPFKVDPASSAPSASASASGSASPSASASAVPVQSAPPPPAWPRAPEPSATSSNKPRPDPGPGMSERGGRTRRGNPASGALFLVVIIASIGWFVWKRLKRRL